MKQIYLGNIKLNENNQQVQGKLVELNGESFYQIDNFDQMQPFFMSIVSDSDHWMYLSSNGSLTAGRANPEQAIFPYYTDDKIHDYAGITGSKTVILVSQNDRSNLWEPFSNRFKGVYKTQSRLYKNEPGNKIIFEEENLDLKITFRYSWMNSERFGWVRKSTLLNQNLSSVKIELIDGIQNILPYGVNRTMQGMLSTLVDAYKKTELVEQTSLALFRLSSIPVDRAEPSEALKATTVWSTGFTTASYLLSSKQLNKFCTGMGVNPETENLGTQGAYLIHTEFDLNSNEEKIWYLMAEVSQDVPQIKSLINLIHTEKNIVEAIEVDVAKGTQNLIDIVAKADGLQLTADTLNVKRHFANAMFNCMRGGIPFNSYQVQKDDFIKHIKQQNQNIYADNQNWLNAIETEVSYNDLMNQVKEFGNADLIRLTLEYLPLMFSRRHGDPSRPWNLFDIKLKNEDGSPSLYYQGNWRDIFQNWEALAMSYPGFLPGMIAKFLNASTIDGYNAYKITRDGIEWEVLDPEDPWSNIGYWGDHQIIYLEKLLELSEKFYPGQLNEWFGEEIFAYANVPYKHRSFTDLLKNPQDAIEFDDAKHELCLKLAKEIGADGKLIQNASGTLKVNLAEKLLIPLLSKLSNFVPGAGIWMNTQRPEWNDANNALVGIGASMVTLYYMRRYVSFLEKLISPDSGDWKITSEVASLFSELNEAFQTHQSVLKSELTDVERKNVMDALGTAGSHFRSKVYNMLSGEKASIASNDVIAFLQLVKQYIDHSIQLNRRENGLYHAYNLIILKETGVGVRYLTEMLEGQVALLSSGYLNPNEALALLNTLRDSKLYRADQQSYILYPNKQLPDLLDKNNIDTKDVEASALLKYLDENRNSAIVKKDLNGEFHFNGIMNNAATLAAELNKLNVDLPNFEEEKKHVLAIYEKLFDHQSFTGRSGTFYKYEGLGCIYWHMVSKLLLAVGENIVAAEKANASAEVTEGLKNHYKAIRDGIGSHKSPAEYGAFPTDPYSHTPSMAGVQQPGMTGQVKEDLLSRWIELGVSVENGCIHFNPQKVNSSEWIDGSQNLKDSPYLKNFDVKLPESGAFLAFTYCNIPVIYKGKSGNKMEITLADNSINFEGTMLSGSLSTAIFERSGSIKRITVY